MDLSGRDAPRPGLDLPLHDDAGIVDEADLEQQLALVGESVVSRLAGVFGPGSMTWRIDREAMIFLAAGRALLLQLAHPWVAAAVAEHSQVTAQPIVRFHRTFNIVFALVFGSLDQAFAAARSLYRRHSAITGFLPDAVGPFRAGSRYCANNLSALRWVYATLIGKQEFDEIYIEHDANPPIVLDGNPACSRRSSTRGIARSRFGILLWWRRGECMY